MLVRCRLVQMIAMRSSSIDGLQRGGKVTHACPACFLRELLDASVLPLGYDKLNDCV